MGCIHSKDIFVVNVDGKTIACTRNQDKALGVYHRNKDKPNTEVIMYLPDEKSHCSVVVIHNRPYVRKGPIGRAQARPIGEALLASGARQEGPRALSKSDLDTVDLSKPVVSEERHDARDLRGTV